MYTLSQLKDLKVLSSSLCFEALRLHLEAIIHSGPLVRNNHHFKPRVRSAPCKLGQQSGSAWSQLFSTPISAEYPMVFPWFSYWITIFPWFPNIQTGRPTGRPNFTAFIKTRCSTVELPGQLDVICLTTKLFLFNHQQNVFYDLF